MPKHRAGTGIAGKHTTIIDAAETVVDALKKLEGVRLTLGRITKVKPNGKQRIKCTKTTSGFKIKIIGSCYAQTFFVIVSDAEKHRSRVMNLAVNVFE